MTREEEEYWRLRTEVSRIEAYVANGKVSGDLAARRMLLAYVQGVQKRLGELELAGMLTPEEEKERKSARDVAAVRYLVEKESALSDGEKQQYASLLERDFFTKSDFESLGTFYGRSWDKLTEGGKAQMSHRVWEGVRRDHYEFSELPETVRKKEAERLHEMFSGAKRAREELENIPGADKQDFMNAWEQGRHRDSYEVLDRPSFKENVSLSSREVHDKHVSQKQSSGRVDVVVAEQDKAQESSAKKSSSDGQLSADILGELNAPPKSRQQTAGREVSER